MYISIQLLV